MMLLYVLFNVFAVAGLLVGAMGAHSAAKAHRRTAQVLREMAETWGAISQAQTFIGCGRYDDANRELDRAANVLIARRRRNVTDEGIERLEDRGASPELVAAARSAQTPRKRGSAP